VVMLSQPVRHGSFKLAGLNEGVIAWFYRQLDVCWIHGIEPINPEVPVQGEFACSTSSISRPRNTVNTSKM
jgi:hypothetical protein